MDLYEQRLNEMINNLDKTAPKTQMEQVAYQSMKTGILNCITEYRKLSKQMADEIVAKFKKEEEPKE